MTKTILLTGGSGYLGRRLTAALEEKGYHTVCLRRQQAQTPQQIDAAFAQGPVFAVIHLATCYGRNGETFPTVIESNLRYPAEVLAAAVKHRVPVFINTDTILARFINPYALSKAQFAEWLRLYCGQITAVNMRLDHFYGPFDTPNKFVAFLLKSFRENRPVLELTEGDYFPVYVAHGFQPLQDDSGVYYQPRKFSHLETCNGVFWNDPKALPKI